MTEEEQPPSLAERYTTSVSTSNLRVEAERRTPADMVIAAGMNRHRLGMALRRLASEWDGMGKPPKLSTESIETVAKRYPRIPGSGLVAMTGTDQDGNEVIEQLEPLVAAKREVDAKRQEIDTWHAHELGLLFQRLKTLPEVRHALIHEFQRRVTANWHAPERFPQERFDEVPHVIAAVLKWWLDSVCPVCHGVKQKVIAGTGRTSSKNCHECKGSGERNIPHGWKGRKVVAYMGECLKAATSDFRHRFRHQTVRGRP